MSSALRVALVAISLGLDVFAVCIGVGVRGTPVAARFRIGAAFAGAEVLMNVIGAAIGAAAGHEIGEYAAYIGFGALVAVGLYMTIEALRGGEEQLDLSHGYGLMIASLSISLDSLGIGFSLNYIGVPIAVTLAAIAFASVLSTALGLMFGSALGKRMGEIAGVLAGLILAATGVLFIILHLRGVS